MTCFSQTFSSILSSTLSQSTICVYHSSMSKPGFKTNPAELMLALSASHMLTSLILLDINLALRARFTIKLDVIYICRVFLFLVSPFFKLLAGSRHVPFFITLETETVTTFTVNVYISTERTSLDQLVAVFVWAPLYARVLICEISKVPI